ncbi:hypothetical protein OHA21_22960 [Actinoplanes sp. NBC_00393]|uniref:phosphotransferase n=1 Tax=Actinoplanes sp. NBC_00393 TaxID=2975953 RepID=UPI002E21036A
MPRYHWHDLPAGTRAAVEEHTGPVELAESVGVDSLSALVTILRTGDGDVFCKGIPIDDRQSWQHRNEARGNVYVRAFAPRLRWHVERDGWLLLGFDPVAGRHIDLTPGSPDLPVLAATLTGISTTRVPPSGGLIASIRQSWGRVVDPRLIAGDALVHGDAAPSNFLTDGTTVRVVDWAKMCHGAPWVDTTFMAIRLVHAGHTPAEAEQWANSVPAWREAPRGPVTALAGTFAKYCRMVAERTGSTARADLADAAHRWVQYRERPAADLVQVVFKF